MSYPAQNHIPRNWYQHDNEQRTVYLQAYEQEQTFYTGSIYASLCISPTRNDWSDRDTNHLKQLIVSHTTIHDRLQELQKWSCKYKTIIESILQNPNKLFFIYCNKVVAPGIDLFCDLLPLFNVEDHMRTSDTKKFLKLTGDTLKKQELINKFNNPNNYSGDIIQVIIGSEVISEGFSFKNIQEVHIVTPHWNYSETIQAISRAIRVRSHTDLIINNIIPIVSIYLHVAIASDQDEQKSIDLKMYQTSEEKDKRIKVIERLLKESAIDCSFNIARNQSGIDGSRECDYTTCKYTCISDNTQLEMFAIDVSNVSVIYQFIEHQIRRLFTLEFSYSFREIVLYMSTFNQFQIMSVLFTMFDNGFEIFNKFGFKCRIREYLDYFYLIDSVDDTKSYISNFYV